MGSWHNLRKTLGTTSDSVGKGLQGWLGVRVRLLSIVVISSVTLLAIGGGAAVYLVNSAREAKDWSELASSTTAPAILMVSAFQEERRLSLLRVVGDPDAAQALVAARQRSDEALAAVKEKGDVASELNPDGAVNDVEAFFKLFSAIPTVRAGVDSQQTPPADLFAFYTSVIGTIVGASLLAARVAPDAKLSMELNHGIEALRAAEAQSQADTMGAVAVITGEFPDIALLEFSHRVGEFRSEVAYSAVVLQGKRLAQLQAITASPAWQQVVAMQDALLLRGAFSAAAAAESAAAKPDSRTQDAAKAQDKTKVEEPEPLPLTVAAWQEASGQVNAGLQKLWEDQSRDAHATAHQQSNDATRDTLLGSAGVLLVAILAFLAALVLANRFIARMRRLRDDTLELATEKMPELMQRLGAGEELDPAAEVVRLDFGTDELGDVADAFNRAHVVAVGAAVAEAKTRAGINAVFLNIAHRSQVVVHRQLALLDRAEREEQNADQLELLFQLDHLATRARRNAENLIILGGEQPGRRWRNPVALLDLVRGAVAESLDYTRIETGRMPEVRVASHAVADIIHLLAELTDNATACSPPESMVTVTGLVVGRGVVVEITDQGLGMSEAEYADRNAMLANPPDFSVATLSGNTRLGLFVVAKLAARHGVSVRLVESVYSGCRAIVLIPQVLVEGGRHHPPVQAPPGTGRNGVTELRDPGLNSLTSLAALADAVTTGSLPVLQQPPVSRPPLWENGTDVIVPVAPVAEPPAAPAEGGRPELPRRNRQAHRSPVAHAGPVVPATAQATAPGGTAPAGSVPQVVDIAAAQPFPPATPTFVPPRKRTAEEARNLMSAIAKGTRQGRQPRVEPEKGPQ
ncbi:nitrate- and nitrite sensing domain-containing protein [Nocardia sp. NPDC005978]|uniref:sensor histidine kinase n=1 Tax=Nocardia sp. NPDC005978 TaxID=3156725 RepID=UPI0033B7BB9E